MLDYISTQVSLLWTYYHFISLQNKQKCINININGKMISVETIPEIWEGENKGEWWSGWIQIWYIVRNFVNSCMYPHPAQQ
jgi:hypothetical protein